MNAFLCRSLIGFFFALAQLAAAGEPPSDDRPTTTITIAAWLFEDAAPDKRCAPLAEAVGEMLAAALGRMPGVAVVERAALDKILAERGVMLSGLTGQAERAGLGRLLGASHILIGTLTVTGDRLRLSVHLIETATTRVIGSAQAEGALDDPFRPCSELTAALAEVLKRPAPALRALEVDKAPAANLHLMRGLGFYYARMEDRAIAEFMKALALKTDLAAARYWLGVSYRDLKETEHARIEFERFLKDYPRHKLAPQVKKMSDK